MIIHKVSGVDRRTWEGKGREVSETVRREVHEKMKEAGEQRM